VPLRDPDAWFPEAREAFARGKRPLGLVPGHELESTFPVSEDELAERVGSGELPVLASPAIVARVERTAVHLLRLRLPPELTTVGASFVLSHEAPTPPGTMITLTVRLEPGDGRKLTFAFVASDPSGEVARGSHVRVIVDRAAFLASAEGRAGRQPR